MALTPEQRQSYGEYYIRQTFAELMGREPTALEIARLFPSMGNDPNVHDTATMRQRVAELATQEQERLKPEQEEKKREDKAKEYQGSIAELIKSTLGRDATKQEIDHFARLRADGFDEYELGQALTSLPEYQQKQDAAARESLRGELATADQQFFEKNVMPSIQARMAQQGRSVESSNFAAQLANAAKDIQSERGTYLAGLGRADYENRRGMAIDSYLQNLQRGYANQDYGRLRADQLTDAYRSRQYELANYDMEKRAYDDYLRNYGKRKKGGLFGGSAGTLIGTGLGAALAAPTGGMSIPMGASLGGMLGGAGGSMFGQ